MTFVLTLQPTGNAGRILSGNGEFIARVPIGYDDTTNEVYSAFAALSPYPGAGPGDYEFVFNLVRVSQDGEASRDFWDGLQTKEFLPSPEQRNLVFREICEILIGLIEVADPVRIVMTTHESGLPEPALRKFQKITIVLRELGFDARAVNPFHGHRMWIAIK